MSERPTVKIREHRGHLDDSLATVAEIEPTIEAVTGFIADRMKHFPSVKVSPELVSIEKYMFDDRIGWDTYIVSLKGYGVFGFTDGPIK